MARGGRRPNTGRKVGSGKYGEATKAIRVPLSMLDPIQGVLNRISACRKKVKQSKDIGTILQPADSTAHPLTLYSSNVSAGTPFPTEDYAEGQIDLNQHLLRNPKMTFFVRVSGDSMINAGIHPDDLLIVDRSLRPSNGRIVIAVVNGELTVKRLFRTKGQMTLMPENDAYASIEITEEVDFMVWGVVTNVIHQL